MQRRQLEYFVAVVDCGSISAAAQKLYVAQPSLSRVIAAMERQAGLRLLERNSRGVAPTPAGQQLYYYACTILDKFEMLDRLYQGREQELVSRLHVSVALLFLPDDLLRDFYSQIQTPDAEVCFYETNLEQALDQVAGRRSELGLVVVNDHQLPLFTKSAEAREVQVVQLGQPQPVYIHLRRGHPLARQPGVECLQLFPYPRVMLQSDFFSHVNHIMTDGVRRPPDQPRRTITVNSYHSLLRMLQYAEGYLVGNAWQRRELEACGIVSLPLTDAPVKQNLLLLRRPRESLSRSARFFLHSFLQDQGIPDPFG